MKSKQTNIIANIFFLIFFLAITTSVNAGSVHVYEAENLQHNPGTGSLDNNIGGSVGWAADISKHGNGYMIFGPYATDWGTGRKKLIVRALVDQNKAGGNQNVAYVEVWSPDAPALVNTKYRGRQLMSKINIRRDEFQENMKFQDFVYEFNIPNIVRIKEEKRGKYREEPMAGKQMEVRVWWHDRAYLKIDKIIVQDN